MKDVTDVSAVNAAEEPADFIGEIRVAARVIDYLSSGLYENAAACMKELINNSFDADATEVMINVRPDADVISVEDNGDGLTRAQFVQHFSRVAESHKRDEGDTTALGRKKIGRIGIGFIAANELCDVMEIYSTVRGSAELLHVVIEFGAIRDAAYADRKRAEGAVKKGDYHGETLDISKDEHFTKVYLKDLREPAREQFVKESGILESTGARSIYGLKPATITKLLASLDSWDELDLYSQTRLRIGLNVPVEYLPNWCPPEAMDALGGFSRRMAELDFKVTYDGTPLLKPIVLNSQGGRFVARKLRYQGDHISLDGYIFARHGALRPRQLNGLLIRSREAAVGEYERSFMGYPQQLSTMFQGWTSAEVYVGGALDDALNIDRRTLRDTHPAYLELQNFLLGELGSFWADVRRELYNAPSRARQKQKAVDQLERIEGVAERVRARFGEPAAATLAGSWPLTGQDDESISPAERRRITRTFTVGEVYEIAVGLAERLLPPDLAAEYIAELTKLIRD